MPGAYEVVIGLEVHVELHTASKIFCSCPNKFGNAPNTNVCPVCLGLPGTLPVFNKKALELSLRAALALDCQVNPFSRFARKNYFYPDLPKAYQISQYEYPIAGIGSLDIFKDGELVRTVSIERLHLEEDAGKLLHDDANLSSYVDYNRCGVPLIEIVTAPDIRSSEEARLFLESLRRILLYTEISDCKMEEGSLRCDANISLRPPGTEALGNKVEIKNMNSFKAVQRGLDHEVVRQTKILDKGGRVSQGTRRWHEDKGLTSEMRSKEEEQDYRYFPEPDLPPVVVDDAMLKKIKNTLPELPVARYQRLMADYGLSAYQAEIITTERSLADFFEETLHHYSQPQKVANWLLGDVLKVINLDAKEIDDTLFTPTHLAELLDLIDGEQISGPTAKEILEECFKDGKMPAVIMEEKGLGQISDTDELAKVVAVVLEENQLAIKDYHEGNKKVITYLMGNVMKITGGKANPQLVTAMLKERLDK